MSGGGGGGNGGSFGSPDRGTDCARLRFRAALQSPQPDAVASLAVDDQLDVVLAPGSETTAPVIEVRQSDGTTVGSLIDYVTELLRCLREGYEYVADVLEISGGAVRVLVRRR